MTASATSSKTTAPPQNGPKQRSLRAVPRVPLLHVDELAEWLGVEAGFVRRMIAQRRIPFVKIGKYVRFDPDEVAEWIDAQRIGPERPARYRSRRP